MALRGESILTDGVPTLDASALSAMMKLTERRSADGSGDLSSSACWDNENETRTEKKHVTTNANILEIYRNGSMSNVRSSEHNPICKFPNNT